ncbi:dicarboxylate/amino acid:cation symporter [Enterococcus faecalis]
MKIRQSTLTQITIAVMLGLLVGLMLPTSGDYLKTIGDVFLRLMQMAIPLLILGQIVQALGSIQPKEVTNLGGRTIAVFGISSFAAALWGVLLAVIFRPGQGIALRASQSSSVQAQKVSISETIINIVPKNLFESLTEGSIIQVIVFALFFGMALNRYLQHRPQSPLLQLVVDFNEVIVMVIKFVMYLAPLGIFALIAATISNLGLQIILPMLKYVLTYGVATLLFLALWVLIITCYCRVNPLRLLSNMREMSVMALATTSSAITLPIELEEAQTKLGLSQRITNLVLPLGMSLNSNGSALHMAFTVMTIAQMYQRSFDWSTMLYLALVATFVSLANAVVPGAGLISLAVIVPQMGLPLESIAIFGGVEWFVGMLRTILNVNSDVYSAILVAQSVDEIDWHIFNRSLKTKGMKKSVD